MMARIFVCYTVFSCMWVGDFFAGGLLVRFPQTTCEEEGQVCIQIRKCPFFDDLLNRSSIPRPRSVISVIRKYQCAILNNTPYVCCDKPTPPSSPPPTSPPPTSSPPTPQLEREEREDSLTITYEAQGVDSHKNFHLLRNDICGPILTDFRITSGKETVLDEFPWMALIVYNTDHGFDFRCGGTVINERYVLTAAHCILESSIVGVRLGEHNVDTIEDCDSRTNYCAPPTQDFYIEDIITHPKYDPKTYVNDIALIRLATPASFNVSNVQPICLPFSEMNSIGKFGIVSGWGVTESGFKSSELLKVDIPVLPISVCQRNYKRFDTITSNQICAGGYKGKDSCGGDSGGPLKNVGLIHGKARFIQYGIVSYGPRFCGADGHPAIYTKVSRYMEWILDNMKPDEDDG